MRFGDAVAFSVWSEDADARAAGLDFASEPERLATADPVVVIACTGFDARKRANNQRLAVEHASAAIAELAALITDYRPREPMDLMEWPVISVVFLKERRLIAEYGLLSRVRPAVRGHLGSGHQPPTIGNFAVRTACPHVPTATTQLHR